MRKTTLMAMLNAVPTAIIELMERRSIHSASKAIELLMFSYLTLPTAPRGLTFDSNDENRLTRDFISAYCDAQGAILWPAVKAVTGGAR